MSSTFIIKPLNISTAEILTQCCDNVRSIFTTRFANITPTGTFPVIRCWTTSSFAIPPCVVNRLFYRPENAPA